MLEPSEDAAAKLHSEMHATAELDRLGNVDTDIEIWGRVALGASTATLGFAVLDTSRTVLVSVGLVPVAVIALVRWRALLRTRAKALVAMRNRLGFDGGRSKGTRLARPSAPTAAVLLLLAACLIVATEMLTQGGLDHSMGYRARPCACVRSGPSPDSLPTDGGPPRDRTAPESPHSGAQGDPTQ